ncbi:MAG: ATP-binding protein [Xylophilus ampelinus]
MAAVTTGAIPSPTAATRLRMLARRCLPDTLFARLAALLIAAVVLSHALALTLMFELHPPEPRDGPWEHPSPHSGAPADARMPPPPGPRGPPPQGVWDAPPAMRLGLLLDIGVRLAALVIAAWWAARWLSRPMNRLSAAARDWGTDPNLPPLPEDGSRECRDASRVFNGMRSRIRHQLDERDRFVAAVSHDLRTPLTRLRLRTENLSDPQERACFGRDIAEMDAMIASTLDHLRGVAASEPWVRLDVRALADSLADDQAALGHAVQVDGAARPLRAQAGALRRCMDNLIGNAVRYGGGVAEVSLHDAADALTVVVRDRGPGLPPEEFERVLQPFYRVESSRNRQTGGSGLGLAIVHDIVRRHGGRLGLSNADGGGLRVAVIFPRRDENHP